MSQSSIPILTYHSLDRSGSIVSVAPAAFRSQMAHLNRAGFRALSLAEVARFIHEGTPFPTRTFAITFDDGYENVYTEAFPILQEYGFTATVFLITDYCGKLNNWPGHVSPVGLQTLLSWPQITEMHRYGFQFGSHTVTHPDLTRASRKAVVSELRDSQAALHDRVGSQAGVFAYPYGRYAPWIVDMVRQEFVAACSTRLGKTSLTDDPCLLPRVDMYYLSNRVLLRALATRGMTWYLGYRHVLRATKQWMTEA